MDSYLHQKFLDDLGGEDVIENDNRSTAEEFDITDSPALIQLCNELEIDIQLFSLAAEDQEKNRLRGLAKIRALLNTAYSDCIQRKLTKAAVQLPALTEDEQAELEQYTQNTLQSLSELTRDKIAKIEVILNNIRNRSTTRPIDMLLR